MIIAIANRGIIPAALINQSLLLAIELLRLSFRHAKQKPLNDTPKLIEAFSFDPVGKNRHCSGNRKIAVSWRQPYKNICGKW